MSISRWSSRALLPLILLAAACGGGTEPSEDGGGGGGGGGGGSGTSFSGDSLTAVGFGNWWRALAVARSDAPLARSVTLGQPVAGGATWGCPGGGSAHDSVQVFAGGPPPRKFYAKGIGDLGVDSVRITVGFSGCRVTVASRDLEFTTITPIVFTAGASGLGGRYLVREVSTQPPYASTASYAIRDRVTALAPYAVSGMISYKRPADSTAVTCSLSLQLAAGPMEFRVHESAWDNGWALPFVPFIGTDVSGTICGRVANNDWLTATDSLTATEAEQVLAGMLAGGMGTWDTAAAERRPDWGASTWDSTYNGSTVHTPYDALVRAVLDEAGSCGAGGYLTNYTLSERLSPADAETRRRGYGFTNCTVAGIRIWGGLQERTEFTLASGPRIVTAGVTGSDTGRFVFRTADGRLGRCIVSVTRVDGTLNGTVCGRAVSGVAAADGVGALGDLPRATIFDGVAMGYADGTAQPFYHGLLLRRIRGGIGGGWRQGAVIFATTDGCCGVKVQSVAVIDWSAARADNGQVFVLSARRTSNTALPPATYPVDYTPGGGDDGADSVRTGAQELADYALAGSATQSWASRAGSFTVGTPTWDGAAVACPPSPGVTYAGTCSIQYGTVDISYSDVEMWSGATLNDPTEILRRTASLATTTLPAIRIVEGN